MFTKLGLYPKKEYDYDTNGNLIYEGFGSPKANIDDSAWLILKHFYDNNNNRISTRLSNNEAKYNKKWVNRNIYDYTDLSDNQASIIDNITWDNDDHSAANSYILTINAHDPDNADIISYSVTCDDINVNIVQDTTNDNIFTITYPNYNIDTNVTYTIAVTDNHGLSTIINITKLVANNNQAPIIDSIIWDNNNHNAANSYTLTINAEDPNDNDTLSYNITCNDNNISIIQNTDNNNIFTITYPNYNIDTNIIYTITVTDNHGLSTIANITKLVANNNQAPIINNISWNNNNHNAANNYILIIDAEDPNNNIITYSVTCDDNNVSIVQNTTNDNIFTITYPNYSIDTNVTYTITVTDNYGLSTTINTTKLVANNNQVPIIDNISWDINNHNAANSYTLTIIAHDPDDNDSISNYSVTCDDSNVSIEQDTDNNNIFTITYPNYSIDTNVTYTIAVTDNYNTTNTIITTKLVANNNQAPIIDNISWNNDNHNAANSYTLTITAHDPDDNDSISNYNVICDDSNVSIEQDTDNNNIFTITYPDYSIDTNVIYTITVTDNYGLSITSNITKLVINNNQAPIIDNITWDNDNHIENNSYILTITAHDPDDNDNISGYNVTCNDINVSIVQNTDNNNIFTITYPDYNINTNVTYTITVTDNYGLSTTSNITKLVQIIIIYSKGVFGGGYNITNTIDYITISTLGDAQDFGDLTTAKYGLAATSNGTNERGIFGGGYGNNIYQNTIDYITISTLGDAQDFGDLTVNRNYLSATSNGTNNKGIFGGGWNSNINTIDYITISTLGDAQDFGDLTTVKYGLTATSNDTNDRGVFSGGYNGNILNTIDYITISTLGNAQDFGDLTIARYWLAATSNSTNNRGVFGGGYGITNTIDYITISTLGNAQDFGDLTVIRYRLTATSNGTNDKGVFSGGNYFIHIFNIIDYITISTLGNAQDFGDLTITRYDLSATSNA